MIMSPRCNNNVIFNQLIMETPRKNVNKDGICLLGSRPIDPKQTIRIKDRVKNIAKIHRR